MFKRNHLLGLALVTTLTLPGYAQQDLEASQDNTWAERLGFEPGRKVLMLHADDAGMCEEANAATQDYLLKGQIQSAAAMAPTPDFEPFIAWAKKHPELDIGLHLTLTSEWQTYRWPAVLPEDSVPGLIDGDHMLWHEVRQVAGSASAAEVEQEIRAQLEKSIALGYRPNHIDTHMGTLFARVDYARAFMKVAQEYNIPANVIDFANPEVVAKFRAKGYPVDDEMLALIENYSLPKLDNFTWVPKGDSYEQVRDKFFALVKSLDAGLTEIVFHPTVPSARIKSGAIMNAWRQRQWEAELFADPEVQRFFEKEGIVFTNWKEIMQRFEQRQVGQL